MTVIDCRFRPLTPEFECYITPEPANFWVTQTRPLKPEPLETTMKYFRKMGITGAVCSGRDMRSVGGAHIPNEYIADLVKQYPVFIGVAGADPQNGHVRSDIEHAVRNLGLKGVSVDPFALKTTADDKRFYPIYETCAELNVPVIITIGPLPIRGGSYMEWGSPLPVDHICADLPTSGYFFPTPVFRGRRNSSPSYGGMRICTLKAPSTAIFPARTCWSKP